jgi:transposase
MAGIAVTRKELSAAELRSAAGKTRDARAARRMLAIALVLEGMDRETAARTCGMERQTLRDWVHRYNAEGLSGLVNLRGAQRPRRLTPEQMTMLAAWVEAGPDAAKDGVVRWRRRDLQARIAAEFGVTLHERTVGKQLAALGFRRLSVRPQHPGSNPEAQTAFKKTSPKRWLRRSRSGHGASRWRYGSRMKQGSASRAR